MDGCCEGMGNWHLTSQVSFYVPPRPPSWHVQIQRQTCQPLEIVSGQSTLNWCFQYAQYALRKKLRQLLHFWKAHVLKFPFTPKLPSFKKKHLLLSHMTHEHTLKAEKDTNSFLTWKTCLFDYRSLQNEHMSSSNKIGYMCHCVKLWTNVSSCLCSSQALCSTNVGHMLSRTKVHMYRRRGWNGRNHSIKLRRPQVDPPRLNTDLSWAQAMLRNGKLCHWDFKK